MSSDSIDPLQFLKRTGLKSSRKFESTTDSSYRQNNSVVDVKSATMTPDSVSAQGIGINEVISKIELREVSLLSNLPYEVYITFIGYCRQYVPRVSITAAAIHLMMLVPTLNYLKLQTEIKILPFLYLGPVVFAIPYVALFLWENNIVTIPLVEDKMKQFIYALKTKAKFKMEELESINMNTREQVSYTASEDLDKLISQRALVQLLAKIDVDVLTSEVLTICKSKSKNRIRTVDSYSDSERGVARASGSVADAVQSLLLAVEDSGSKQEALERLKELQRELDDTMKN
eukprot:gene33778-43648_t